MLRHDDALARHRDHRGDRRGQRVDLDVDGGGVVEELAVDPDAFEDVAARRVDADGDLVGVDRRELGLDVARGRAEEADLVVDEELNRAVRLILNTQQGRSRGPRPSRCASSKR